MDKGKRREDTNGTRERILTIEKIMLEETGPEDPISMDELLQCLETKGITVNRKTVYRDMEALKKFYNIQFQLGRGSKKQGWFAAERKE